MFELMDQAILPNQLRSTISQPFAFDDAIAAWHVLRDAQHTGKIVIAMPDAPERPVASGP